MNRQLRNIILIATSVALLFGAGVLLYRKPSGLVTLDVRNAPLEKVIRSMELQTGEEFVLQPGATGQITLHVKRIPFQEALQIVADQADCRYTDLYALYRSRRSHTALVQSLRSAKEPRSPWTNLNLRALPTPGVAFARNASTSGNPVTLLLHEKTLTQAARALSRFGRASVIAEDGIGGTLNLKLESAAFESAVRELARKSGTRIARCHVLGPLFQPPAASSADGDVLVQGGPERLTPNGEMPTMIPLGNAPPPDPQMLVDQASEPDPEAVKGAMRNRMLEDLRTSTPEQRAERWRRSGKVPSAPGPVDGSR